jgi:hypothetical protein
METDTSDLYELPLNVLRQVYDHINTNPEIAKSILASVFINNLKCTDAAEVVRLAAFKQDLSDVIYTKKPMSHVLFKFLQGFMSLVEIHVAPALVLKENEVKASPSPPAVPSPAPAIDKTARRKRTIRRVEE